MLGKAVLEKNTAGLKLAQKCGKMTTGDLSRITGTVVSEV